MPFSGLRQDLLVEKKLLLSVRSLPYSLVPKSQHRLVEIVWLLLDCLSSAVMPWRCIARSETDVEALDQDLFDFVQAQHLSLVIQAVDAKTLNGNSLPKGFCLHKYGLSWAILQLRCDVLFCPAHL